MSAIDLLYLGGADVAAVALSDDEILEAVREWVDSLEEDRPIGPDVDRLAGEALAGRAFLARVRAAVTVA